MKKLVAALFAIVLLSGCATSQVATQIGSSVGESFKDAAAQGTISAESSIKAWPYISGMVKGLLSDNYNLETPTLAQNIIGRLDALARKDQLTTEEKGFVVGSFVRLEAIAVEQAWSSKYGISFVGMIKKAMLH